MTLAWTTNQPTEEGFYWAAAKGSDKFGVVYLQDGFCYPGGSRGQRVPVAEFDLWSWPVEVPPAPVRPEPAKETTDVPPTPEA